MMISEDYQINELAKKAGVSVRTIRFYIDEGLLPVPSTRGRYTVYSDEYLERIELIRLLKNRFLPLREIRTRLAALSPQEIRDALEEERRQERKQGIAGSTDSPGHPGGKSASALDYVNNLLKEGPVGTVLYKAASREHLDSQVERVRSRPYGASEDEETWTHIRLAPGVELHIQQPVEPGTRNRLRLLLDAARKIFNI